MKTKAWGDYVWHKDNSNLIKFIIHIYCKWKTTLQCLYHSILHILLLTFPLIYSCSMSTPQHDSMPSCAGIWLTAYQSYSSSQKGNWILVKIGTCLQMCFKPMQLKMLNNNSRRMIYDWHALKLHIKYAHRCVPRLKWFMMVGFTNVFEKAVPGFTVISNALSGFFITSFFEIPIGGANDDT